MKHFTFTKAKQYGFLLIISCFLFAFSQPHITNDPPILDSDYIASKTAYFSVKEEVISGKGLETLKQIFQESQFVVFGERHSSLTTSLLTTALMPLMNENAFNAMCLEVGPHSANKLKELMTPAEKTIENLRKFNSYYYNKEIDDVPIPFFAGIEDAQFLEKASKYNMDIWGLDQEYFTSILYFTDELLAQAKEEKDYPNIKSLKEKADKVILEWLIKGKNLEEEIDVFNGILNESDVQAFFNVVEHSSPKASAILKDLKISWDIYSRWRDGSHVDRITYMRNNFLKYYKAEKKKNAKAPKVFLKFGQLHASQIMTNGAYDIGHLANELAKKENAKCANINSWTRYYLEDGKEIDYLEEYADFYKSFKLFISQAKREEWTIIDLKSIREDINNNKIQLPENSDLHKINSLIQGYDYQLILPLDQDPNYNIDVQN